MKTTISLDLSRVEGIIEGDDTGLFIASEMRKGCDPYVPFRNGGLSQDVTIAPWSITYEQDQYASRIYDGDHFNFSHDIHPLATAHWDMAWKANHLNEFIASIEKYLRSRL